MRLILAEVSIWQQQNPWPGQIFFTSFIHSGYFCSTSSSPVLLRVRGTPDKARILCRSFTPKRNRQLQVKDLPKVAKVGFVSTTLWTKGAEFATTPHFLLTLLVWPRTTFIRWSNKENYHLHMMLRVTHNS